MKRSAFNRKAFTLTELLLGAFVLLVVVLALWGIYGNSLNYVSRAKEVRIATDDLQDVMEKMQCVAFSDIKTLFPDGAAVNPAVIGGFVLNNESIVVRYTGADPLEIEVEISWTDNRGDPRSKVFRTIRTGSI
ncbi:MAG: hypothetical protein DRP85_01200 [Candidatus Makaraimicrobium thalassicum]|nr:MAG: hypothetical protein DRP85_01200 [Candidatus Omnitrophota bacterium]